MTIASEVTKLNTNLTNSYTAVSGKGGTLPQAQNFDNLATAISSIPSGGGGGYSELPNYQVDNGVASRRTKALTGNEFSSITSVGSGGLRYAFYYDSGLSGKLDFSSLTTVGSTGMPNAFAYCTGLSEVDFSSLTTVENDGLRNAFQGCSGLTTVDFSSLTTIKDNGLNSTFYESGLRSVNFPLLTTCNGSYAMGAVFGSCKRLETADLSALTTLGSYSLSGVFNGCYNLTTVDLSALTTLGSSSLYNAFKGCTSLTTVDLSALTTLGSSSLNNAFNGCTSLTNVYFRALTTSSFGSYRNQFSNMMSSTGTSKTHKLHFPSNMQSTISGLTGYPLFGGSSGKVTLSFDLPATS